MNVEKKIVGIKKKDDVNFPRENKKPKRPEKYFREAAKIWIEVYGELLPNVDGQKAKPSFWTDGAEKRNLKNLLCDLRERAEEKNIEWTAETMGIRFRAFLLKAWEDDFISKNYMLRIINNNKTKIFNNQITPKNGKQYQGRYGKRKPNTEIKPDGDFGEL